MSEADPAWPSATCLKLGRAEPLIVTSRWVRHLEPRGWVCLECPRSELLCLYPQNCAQWGYPEPSRGDSNCPPTGMVPENCRRWGVHFLSFSRVLLTELSLDLLPCNAAREPSTYPYDSQTEACPGDTKKPSSAWLPGTPMPHNKAGVDQKICPSWQSYLPSGQPLLGNAKTPSFAQTLHRTNVQPSRTIKLSRLGPNFQKFSSAPFPFALEHKAGQTEPGGGWGGGGGHQCT